MKKKVKVFLRCLNCNLLIIIVLSFPYLNKNKKIIINKIVFESGKRTLRHKIVL